MKQNTSFFTFFVILVVILMWSMNITASQLRGQQVKITIDGRKEVDLYAGSYALVIGASEYSNGWKTLNGVKRDVVEVKTVLEEQGFIVETILNPTRAKFDESIRKFIATYGQTERNRLLIYFAGHGHTQKTSYGQELGYIIPVDAPMPRTDPVKFKQIAVGMNEIENYAIQIECRHAMFIFDSCFSGTIFEAINRATSDAITEKIERPVRQFITAGTNDQTVPDDSLFCKQFVTALRGEADYNRDGFITGSELGMFLSNTVTNYSKRAQTPQWGSIRNPNLDKGDLVFLVNKVDKDTAFWEKIKSSKKLQDFEQYLNLYPAGKFVDSAQAKIFEITQQKPFSQEFKGELNSTDAINIELADLLRTWSSKYKFDFTIDSAIAKLKVSIKVTNVPWSETLEAILLINNLTYKRLGETIAISPQKGKQKTEEIKPFSQEFKGELMDLELLTYNPNLVYDLTEILHFLNNKYKVNFVADTITSEVKFYSNGSNVPWPEMLEAIMLINNLTYRRVGEIIAISGKNAKREFQETKPFSEEMTGFPMNLDVNGIDLRNFLIFLGLNNEINFATDETSIGIKISVQVINVPWPKILEAIMLINNLTYYRIGQVITIYKQPDKKKEESYKSLSQEIKGPPITLDVINMHLSDILRFWSDAYKVNFVIDDIATELQFSAKTTNVPWPEVLEAIMLINNLTYSRVGEIIAIRKNNNKLEIKESKPFSQEFEKTEISLDFTDINFYDFLRYLTDTYKLNLVMGASINIPVSVTCTQISWTEIIEALLFVNDLTYYQVGTTTVILPISTKHIPSSSSFPQAIKDNHHPLSVDLQGVALNEIFTMVAHNYDICFVTNQSVEKKIIFIKVSDKPWPEVIDSILQANNLTFRLIGQKVFAITPNREK